MLAVFFILTGLVLVAVLVVEARHWRSLFLEERALRLEREANLFDQLLKAQGFKALRPPEPAAAPAVKPRYDEEMIERFEARLNERVLAGLMSRAEMGWAMNLLNSGQMSEDQFEEYLLRFSPVSRSYEGSVMDL